MTSKSTQARWRFFLEHAGYATPPGRAQCALDLARAEERANTDPSLRFRWEPDVDPDLSWMSDEERARPHEVEGCIVERFELCGTWHPITSLWGIVDADDAYRRVIEAELACECV